MKLLVDIHSHSTISQHAYSTIDENVRSAAEKGIELLALTDHAPGMPHAAPRAFFANYHVLPKTLHGVELLRGAELNIMDYNGTLDLDEAILSTLDITIASLHPPCIPFGSKRENTNALIKTMENPFVDILGHPGDPRYEIDVEAVFQAAKDTQCILEINNASLDPKGFRTGSDKYISEFIKLCMRDGVPVVIGSDAHFYTQIGNFSYVLDLMNTLGFPKELILNTSPERLKGALKRNSLNNFTTQG